jgi:hypothetical protein
MAAFKDWINGLTSKTTPVDADETYLRDSEASGASKKLTWANIKATLKTYFDTLYTPAGSGTELQYRNSSSFAAVTGSSVDGASLTLGGETVTTSKPVLNLSQTWNAAGVTMTGIRFNVTNTASATDSRVLDIARAGTSRFYVTPAGQIVSAQEANQTAHQLYSITPHNINGWWFLADGSTGGFYMGSGQIARWGSASSFNSTSGTVDAGIARDAAGVLKITDGGSSTLRNLRAGTLALGISAKTADYSSTVYDGVVTYDCSGAARTDTLPALSGTTAGQVFIRIKTDSSGNALNVDANGSETINGSTSAQTTSTQWGVIRVMVNADKSGWITF